MLDVTGYERQCNKCQEWKMLTSFSKDKNRPYGRMYTCSSCDKIRGQQHYVANKEQYALRARKARLKRYGLDVDMFDSMFKQQDGKCPGCGDEFTEKNKPHVDHNHDTGEIRELLCFRCNSAVGYVRERVDILMNLMNYLEKHNG